MTLRRLFFLLTICCFACTRFEDAEPTSRSTFIFFYTKGAQNYMGQTAEIDADGGFILGGNIQHGDNSRAVIIKTDPRGRSMWETVIENARVTSLKSTTSGYFILADGIELNPTSPDVSEIINTQARMIVMDKNGNIQSDLIMRESMVINQGQPEEKTLEIDFHANAIAFDDDNTSLLFLGSKKPPGGNQRAFIRALDATTFDIQWEQSYGLINRDYINCNSLYLTPSSRLVWASNTMQQVQNLSDSYLSILFVQPNSTFENNSLFGENDPNKNHAPADMQKSPSGYGIIGTYADPNGVNANIYFLRVDAGGNVIPNSERYFDGVDLSVDKDAASSTEDVGSAITSVNGGFVLAGSMTTTPEVGNGGKDIILIKVDVLGNFIWSKLIGGSGDETVSSIREADDGGLLICGTNTINGLSSILLMKTDANGAVIN